MELLKISLNIIFYPSLLAGTRIEDSITIASNFFSCPKWDFFNFSIPAS